MGNILLLLFRITRRIEVRMFGASKIKWSNNSVSTLGNYCSEIVCAVEINKLELFSLLHLIFLNKHDRKSP